MLAHCRETPHLGGDARDRTELATLHQTATAFDVQRDVTVGHGQVFPVERTADWRSILPPEDQSPSTHPLDSCHQRHDSQA